MLKRYGIVKGKIIDQLNDGREFGGWLILGRLVGAKKFIPSLLTMREFRIRFKGD
jgi:hypothetical protein